MNSRRVVIGAVGGAAIGIVFSLNVAPGYTLLCAVVGAALGAVFSSRKNREEDTGGYYADDDAGEDD